MKSKLGKIKIEAIISAPVQQAWKVWTTPEDITQWNFASDEWCCPVAINDLMVGGQFSYRMQAKDNSFGFDFSGRYITIQKHKVIEYLMDDGRWSEVIFEDMGAHTRVVETFEAETTNTIETQKMGWQARLNNYKKRAELG